MLLLFVDKPMMLWETQYMEEIEYPDCPALDKLADNTEFHNHVMQFLEWLQETKGFAICARDPNSYDACYYSPVRKSSSELVYGFLDIDPDQIDKEREAVLAFYREWNNRKAKE